MTKNHNQKVIQARHNITTNISQDLLKAYITALENQLETCRRTKKLPVAGLCKLILFYTHTYIESYFNRLYRPVFIPIACYGYWGYEDYDNVLSNHHHHLLSNSLGLKTNIAVDFTSYREKLLSSFIKELKYLLDGYNNYKQ